MTPESKKAARELKAQAFLTTCESYCMNPGDGRATSHAPNCRTGLLRRMSDALGSALDEIDRLEQVLRRIEREDIGLVPTDMTHGCGLIAKNALKESGNA